MALKENELLKKTGLIDELLKKGHRINIFSFKGKNPGLKDHIEIRFIPAWNPVFKYSVLFKLWERRRKKRIEIVIAEDKELLRFFSKFRFVHKADVMDANKVNEAVSDVSKRMKQLQKGDVQT